MALYAFYMCDGAGFSTSFETRELPYDSAAYRVATRLLQEHQSADYVEVWQGERAVLSHHREGPVIRPIDDSQAQPQAPAPGT